MSHTIMKKYIKMIGIFSCVVKILLLFLKHKIISDNLIVKQEICMKIQIKTINTLKFFDHFTVLLSFFLLFLFVLFLIFVYLFKKKFC